MQIRLIEGTDLFLAPAAAPRQVVRVTLAADAPTGPVRVRVEGSGRIIRSLPAAGDSVAAGKTVVLYAAAVHSP